MEYFEKYTSNTCASSANQLYFNMPKEEVRTGRAYFKIFAGGTYNYSFLFSNILDSTHGEGTIGHKNLICDIWTIHSLKVGRCSHIPEDIELWNPEACDFKAVTFDGNTFKKVMPGEFFYTDELELSFEKDEYLCIEMVFSGTMLPYHDESLLPIYIKNGERWQYNKKMPLPGMIGCDRKVNERIVFWGDSITQGIGAKANSYLHWNARLAEMLGKDKSYWNLGIGYGRANDAASGGAWMYKAKHCDTVFVCFGVNDLCRQFTVEDVQRDLTYIVDEMKKMGKRVILQTVPPFDYNEERNAKWFPINDYIKNQLKDKVDYLFDTVPVLGESPEMPHMAKYGGHPNEEGGRVWAEALHNKIKDII